MKAYLSYATMLHERTAAADKMMLGSWDVAEREATRILAETEPSINWDGTRPAVRPNLSLTVATRNYNDYAVSAACLAESLAAFVDGAL